MGLDVYVYLEPASTRQSEKDKCKRYEDASTEIWDQYPKYQQMSDDQKDEARDRVQAVADELGLDKDGCSTLQERVELNSELYPEHMFKIGYFRSSYNGAGTNAVLKKIGIPELQELFEVGDEYNVIPDWNKAWENCKTAIEQFKQFLDSEDSKYQVDVHNFFNFIETEETSPEKTLEIFMEHINRNKDAEDGSFLSYSNKEGLFYLKGKEIKMLRLVSKPPIMAGLGGGIDLHMVTDSKMEDDSSTYDWYLQALEICKETCEYVLKSDNPEDFTMHWSG
jgi:hypothetical protein